MRFTVLVDLEAVTRWTRIPMLVHQNVPKFADTRPHRRGPDANELRRHRPAPTEAPRRSKGRTYKQRVSIGAEPPPPLWRLARWLTSFWSVGVGSSVPGRR